MAQSKCNCGYWNDKLGCTHGIMSKHKQEKIWENVSDSHCMFQEIE